MTERTMANECYSCAFRTTNPSDCHIGCSNPDPLMVGNAHGIAHGWFFYPWNFDPIWKAKLCSNWEQKT